MSGFVGLNSSENGAGIGLDQLKLPLKVTMADLAPQSQSCGFEMPRRVYGETFKLAGE